MNQIILSKHDTRCKIKNNIMHVLLVLCSILAVIPLFLVFFYVLSRGLPALNWDFFTALPAPVGEEGGGMANAILGSLTIVGLASLMGVPFGICIGIYLSEYGRNRFGDTLRFIIDILMSVPSIVVGLFAYSVVVVPMKSFSAYAGAFALALIMFPTVARATEEILKLVPNHIREAGLALGLPRWKVITQVVLRGSLTGVVTGIILAVARVMGETAPLLFTAFGNQFWSTNLSQPIASLPVQIYNFSISPYEDWHRQAWAGAFVLVLIVFVANLITRLFLYRKVR